MPRPRVTTTKRQREQAKRDRQQRKAERRANRSSEPAVEGSEFGTNPQVEFDDDPTEPATEDAP